MCVPRDQAPEDGAPRDSARRRSGCVSSGEGGEEEEEGGRGEQKTMLGFAPPILFFCLEVASVVPASLCFSTRTSVAHLALMTS